MSLLFVRRTARPPLPFVARGRKPQGTKEPSTDFTMMLAWTAVASVAIRTYNLEYMAERDREAKTNCCAIL